MPTYHPLVFLLEISSPWTFGQLKNLYCLTTKGIEAKAMVHRSRAGSEACITLGKALWGLHWVQFFGVARLYQ